MRTGRLLSYGLMIVLLVPAVASAQQRATTNFQSIVVEDFDDPEESPWMVVGSRFIAEDYPRVSWVRTFPEALYRREPEERTLRALGVQAAFDRKGYNFLEYIPAQRDESGEMVPRSITLPGRVHHIDMWVWGSNFNYYVDIHVQDYRGIPHVLRLGDINFRGWRNLRIPVPHTIPQDSRFTAEILAGNVVSDARSLELTKIVLWTRPMERVNGFFVYFDEINVETDLFREPFDGEELQDPDFIQNLWAEGEGM